MSGLPDQEIKTTYSQDDVQHIVAREMAKQQLSQLQNGQLEINKRLVEIVSEFKSELKGIKEMLDKTPKDVDACKLELKNEIKAAHPDHFDLKEIEAQIHSYKNLGRGLIIGGGIIFILAQYIVANTLHDIRSSIQGVAQSYKASSAEIDKVNRRMNDIETMIITVQTQMLKDKK